MTRAWALVGCLLLLAPGLAGAETETDDAALAAAAKIRAALPDPSPVVSIRFEGDIVLDGLWAGEVTLTLKASKVGRQLVWRATEKMFTDWKGIETRRTTILHLQKDLSIISGSAELRREDRTTALIISRTGKGFFVQRRMKQGEDWKAPELLQMEAPRDATHGLVPMLLFLRHVPAQDLETAYALSHVRWPFEGAPKPATQARLRVGGKATFGKDKRQRESWTATVSGVDEHARSLHLAPDRMTFFGSLVLDEPKALWVVPRGEGGERQKLEALKPSKTWKDAFLKFGYGYHQARRNLLEAAFHWDRFYEHEASVLKRWDPRRPLEEFQKAWIDEFCAQSKHRSEANTKRLLDMTLATGKVKKKTKDTLVFAAHANFGGGTQRTYFFERRDGTWGIVRIDFEE